MAKGWVITIWFQGCCTKIAQSIDLSPALGVVGEEHGRSG